ncbi:hypothetical protein P4T90_24400, partial [Heyndrickxia acidicola]|nr:hypothetical protein [Heyndrickxia acidicola]
MKKKSYTYSELVDYLKFNDEETNLYMPNEIFDDLKSLNIKPTPHLAFTYTYYYFITWLYRYTKFEHTKILTRNIKEVLGYKPDYEKIDYIIKKNGLLDNASYTETTTNYPAYWEFDEWENLKFVLLSELDAEVKSLGECLGANYKVKIPVKHVHRSVESNEDGYEDGVF